MRSVRVASAFLVNKAGNGQFEPFLALAATVGFAARHRNGNHLLRLTTISEARDDARQRLKMMNGAGFCATLAV
jgi:hypothetical protein